jgi:AcrR family transcriptional regulator
VDQEPTGSHRRRGRPAQTGARGAARAQQVLQRAVAIETEILDAAVVAMSEKGYHATSVREIADQAGMSVANVYHYFESKHTILFRLMDDNIQLLITRLEQAIATAGTEPRAQLVQATLTFASTHTTRRDLAFVTSSELRALDPDARDIVIHKRRRVEQLFRQIIVTGRDEGIFRVEDAELSTRMLLDMTRSLAAWYRPDGKLSVDEICQAYVRAALMIVGSAEADQEPPSKRATDAGSRRLSRRVRVPDHSP